MTWRRNPRAIADVGRLPESARFAIYGAALAVAFLILGFLVMDGLVAETDRQIEQLERTHRK